MPIDQIAFFLISIFKFNKKFTKYYIIYSFSDKLLSVTRLLNYLKKSNLQLRTIPGIQIQCIYGLLWQYRMTQSNLWTLHYYATSAKLYEFTTDMIISLVQSKLFENQPEFHYTPIILTCLFPTFIFQWIYDVLFVKRP